MELNLVYEHMKDEDARVIDIKEGSPIKRSSRDFNAERKRKSFGNLQSANNSNSNIANVASTGFNPQVIAPNPNPALFIKLKSDNTEEVFLQCKNLINRMKMSEFLWN